MGIFLCLGSLAGCTAPRHSTGVRSTSSYVPVERPYERTATSRASTAWRFRPLSWEKLEQIEGWLAGSGKRSAVALRVEAELTLARGRLTFAKRDRASISPVVFDSRLRAAGSGFARVLAIPGTGALDRQRAREGQHNIASLQSTSARGLNIIPRTAWQATAAHPSRLTPTSGAWNRLTVHHSAEYAGLMRNASAAQSSRAVRNIQRYHITQQSYGDIGYHYLIDPSGRVFEGRSLRWQGAHAGGNNNINNIGICLLGDFDRESPSQPALTSLETLVAQLRARYRIPRERVVGHGELKTTACPGLHLRPWPARYRGSPTPRSTLAAR